MKRALNIAEQIRQLLRKNTIMSLKKLQSELQDRPRSSLFRDLKKLDVISSYTHTGQYHALRRLAKFDENGLWFFQDVGFSRYGTLKRSLVHVITHSQAGMTHREMRKLFRVEVQKPLTDLVSTNAVARQLLPRRIHVYLSADETSGAQWERRLAIGAKALDVALPAESIRIEILVEVIRAPKRTLEEKVLGPLLRERGVLVKDEEVRYVLAYYDIKKNGF
ncbi:MAG: hypothetical protein GY801_38655 [bacterium]|nr:hypothetical protein [bacterium]